MTPDGVDVTDLASRWGVPTVVWKEQVSSTVDVAHEMAESGAAEGTVVIADEQRHGRGRHGRVWSSGRGAGVWLSFVIRGGESFEAGLLSVRVGLAVAEAIVSLGPQVMLKWPNDIMLQDKKLGGVLCEARWAGDRLQWVIVGIGINVHGPLPVDLVGTAITLDQAQTNVTRLDVLHAVVPRLVSMRMHSRLSDDERHAYSERDWLSGRRLLEPKVGIARGVDVDGALIVETDGAVDRVIGGTVVTA